MGSMFTEPPKAQITAADQQQPPKSGNTYASTRFWDRAFNSWVAEGMLDDKLKPGPHPEPDHLWNTNQEEFIRSYTSDFGNGNGEDNY